MEQSSTEEMAHITSLKASPRYDSRSGQVTLKVDAHGEYERNGIELVQIQSPDGYSVDSAILVVAIRFTNGVKKLRRWSDTKSFEHFADYVVLTCEGHVLAVRPVK